MSTHDRFSFSTAPENPTAPAAAGHTDDITYRSSHGGPKEKREHEEHDDEFNYGGRDHSPDEDVNPAEDIAKKESPEKNGSMQALRSRKEPFASRLPGHAFRRGDLFSED